MKTVVIGIGNPFRGDDAAGMAAVDLIEHQLPAAVDVVCKRVDSGGLGLMEEMAGFDLAILIDACAEGDAPGTIHRRDANQWTESCNTSSSHDGSLADAIEIGKLAGVPLPEEWLVWGIEPESMGGFGGPLTEPVQRAIEQVSREVIEQILAEQGEVRHT